MVAFGMQSNAQNTLKTKVLDNGLTVILNEDHRSPKVFGVVITKAGAKDDPWDAAGMAHYMEHMLFKGTSQLGTSDWEQEKPHIDRIFALYDSLGKTKNDTTRKEIQALINEESVKAGKFGILNEMSNLVYRMGGTKMNAFTSPDVTAYFNEFPPNQINQWLDLYAHRFQEPVFRAFQAELEVVYEEKNMYEDQFQTKLIESFNKYMFKKHPYGQRSLIGTTEDLKNPSLTKMYEFFKTWYVANNMALIITGNFKADEIMPVIEEKFGALKSGTLPERAKYIEEPFNGRELVVEKLTPIKFNLLGYRAPAEGQPEKPVMDVICKMLNNATQTGYFDQLSLDNKLLGAYAIQMPYQDYGSLLVLSIPKIVGQKFEEAENLTRAQMKRLADGDFSEEFLETIKNEFYREQQLKLESLQDKALSLAFAFSQNRDMNEVFNQAEKIRKITVEDVKAVASKYLGDNYLILQSKMGSPKKDKIEKPGFKPIASNTQDVSEYQKHFLSLEPSKFDLQPIDFKKDIESYPLAEKLLIHRNKNTLNDIFTMQISFGVGTEKIPGLEHAINYMNMTGLKETTLNDLKLEFAKLGTTYSFEVNDDFTTINLTGIEKNVPQVLALVNKLMNEPFPDDSKIKVIYEGEKANRAMERKQPDNVAFALYQYAIYGQKSKFLDRLKLGEIKKMKAAQLIETFKSAMQFEVQVFYTGQNDINTLVTQIKNNLRFRENLKPSESPVYKNTVEYPENTVFFANKKKATQAKLFFAAKAELAKEEYAMLEAFNVYIGGGFSGLLAQEVREYRSMAYAVGGGFRMPKKQGNPVHFSAFVGTQADKTLEAASIVDSIIRTMPQKPERMDMIKDYLINKTLTEKPDFRDVHKKVQEWKFQGYSTDPTPELLEKYKNLTWNDLYAFYAKMLKDKKIVMAIAGDKSRIDVKALSKYGKVVEISEKKLFSK
jgi:predicted Zn-dependent peptidase